MYRRMRDGNSENPNERVNPSQCWVARWPKAISGKGRCPESI